MDLLTEKRPKKSHWKAKRSAHVGLWCAYRKAPTDQRRNRLVEAYQSLVAEIVLRFAQRLPRSVDRGDLTTAANVGLMGAVTSFDPGRNVRFEIYAELRIRGAMLDELRNQDWLPRPWRTRLDLQKRTLETLRSEFSREPTDPEVAKVMGLSFDEYEQVFGTVMPGAPGGAMPLADGNEDFVSRLDRVVDTRNGPLGEELNRLEILRLMAQRMTDQEYRIIYLKYWEDLSMREIGELTHLSESRVCKIHAKLLERMKDRFRSQVSESRT